MSAPEIEETVFTSEEIREKVSELAARISEDYRGKDLLMVGILKGAFVFLSDLARRVSVPVEFDFMALSSYGSGTKTSGVVRIKKDLDSDIAGRHVLIIEDIVDSGLTLSYLLSSLKARKPASLEICTLLDKETARQVELPVKYVGYRIPDEFVVGYGLDCAEAYRQLPYIAKVKR